ncbi:MAG TPA: peptide-binding protein [Nitrospiria bacterium]|nr:peptide-binding protein [Nitrospiria bacterium]
MRSKAYLGLWSIGCLVILLIRCTPQGPQNPNTVTVGSIGEAQRLLPMLASDSASGDISGWVFNGLVKYDKHLNLIGDLAESFEASDDCLTVTFHLRKGVQWQDGKELTAEDVLFTYQKMIDPNVATPYSGDFERVAKVEASDPYTLKVTYKEPFAPGLASWGIGIIPKHLLSGVDLNTTDFNRKPIGTGPYKMKEWVTGQKIVLAANGNYFEGRPKVEEYVYRIIPDNATMFLELKSSGLDFMGLSPLQYQRQTDTDYFKQYFKKYRYPAFAYTYLGFNLLDPKFRNRKVRQAIASAIDKKAVIKGVLLGVGRPADQPVPPESWAYNPSVPPYDYNLDRARRLLEEAGWKDTNNDGLVDKDGQPFRFTIITNQGNDERAKTAEIIQQSLKAVGIQVEIRILEWQAFLHQFIDKKKFEAIILGWSLGRDPDSYDIWHSSKTREGEFNFVSYHNPQVDRLLLEGRNTCDQEKRKKIYEKLHAFIAEDQPYIFLYYPDALPVLHKRFKGVEPSPLGIWYNFPTDWYVPKNRAEWYQ